MADVLLPISVDVASIKFRYLESTGVSRNPYNGAIKTASRGGDRIGASLEFSPTGGASSTGKQKQRILKSRLFALKGKQNRLVAYDPSYVQQGSFPATEMLTNNDFSNGTTGWTAGSQWTLSVSDLTIRSARNAVTVQGDALLATLASSLSQYAPYAARFFVTAGSGYSTTSTFRIDDRNNSISGSTLTGFGLHTQAIMTSSGGNIQPAFVDLQGSGLLASNYISFSVASLSRCALIDNGPNALTYSDQFDNAAWTKVGCTVTANNATAPDGTVTGDLIVETAVTSVHGVYEALAVTSAAQDVTFSVDVIAVSRGWAFVQITDNTAHGNGTYVNLSTGALGTASVVGTNITNGRYQVVNRGNGWWRINVTARKSGTQTTIYGLVGAATADNAGSYLGVAATNAIQVWRGVMAVSSVPTRGAQTTSAATTGTAQTGSGLYLKGLPASTSRLLLYGDWVEVITSLGSQLCMVTSSLDSDAAGLGYLQVSPPIRGTVADNAAVIINKPTGRFVFNGDAIEYMNEPGVFSTASVDLEEAPF